MAGVTHLIDALSKSERNARQRLGEDWMARMIDQRGRYGEREEDDDGQCGREHGATAGTMAEARMVGKRQESSRSLNKRGVLYGRTGLMLPHVTANRVVALAANRERRTNAGGQLTRSSPALEFHT